MTRWDRRPWANWAGDVVIERPERHYYPDCLADVLEIVVDAENQNPPRKVRACGSHWALSDAAVSPDWIVETSALRRTIPDVVPAALSQRARDQLTFHPHGSGHGWAYYHVEAGITIRDLNLRLDAGPGQRWALPTMGGAAGQTLAGAIATGVHGGDHDLPPLADFVQAVHLVTTDARQLWIERDDGITDPAALARALPDVTPHYSTELFDAVLIAVGRMGVVYALVIKVVEQFSLDQTIVASTWENQRDRLCPPFEVFDADLPRGVGDEPARTHFVEIVVLPYARGDGRHTCYLTQRWLGPDGPRPEPSMPGLFDRICRHRELIPGPWHVSVGGVVAAACNLANRCGQSWLVRCLNEVLIRQFRSSQRVHDVAYNVMDLGRTQPDCYRGDSIEVCFDASTGEHMRFMAQDVFPIFERWADEGMTLAGYISLRFTQRSSALLAIQRWDVSCCIEIALLQGVTGNLALLDALQEAVVRHHGTVHWGQRNTLDRAGVEQTMPALPEWRRQLARLCGPTGDDTFDNRFSHAHGLEPR